MSKKESVADAPVPPEDPAPRPRLAWDRLDWVAVGLLIVVGLYLCVWGAGSIGFQDPWEPKYPQTVREMAERGDWVTPYFEDDIRWTKPILIYWAIAASSLLGGINEFTARLPSGLAAIFGVVFTYFFVRQLRSRGTAVMAAGILLTMPQYLFLARMAMPDMLLSSSLNVAMGSFALGRFGQHRKRMWFCLGYAAVATAALAKGPLAGAITAGAILLFWCIDLEPRNLFAPRTVWRNLTGMLKSYYVGWGILIFVLVSATWYVPVALKHGKEFYESFILGHNIHRFSDTSHGGLFDTSEKYVQTILHGMFCWSGILPIALLMLMFGRTSVDDEVRQRWYYASWAIVIVALFTFSKTHLDHYILPVTASAAVIVALLWEAYLSPKSPSWTRAALVASLPFMLLPFRDFGHASKYLMDAYTNKQDVVGIDFGRHMAVLFGAWGVATLAAAVMPWRRVGAGLVLAVALGSGVYLTQVFLPSQGHVRSFKQYVEAYTDYKTEHDSDTALIFYGKWRSSISFYSGGRKGYRNYSSSSRHAPAVARAAGKTEHAFIIIGKNRTERVLGLLRNKDDRWRRVPFKNPHPSYELLSNTD